MQEERPVVLIKVRNRFAASDSKPAERLCIYWMEQARNFKQEQCNFVLCLTCMPFAWQTWYEGKLLSFDNMSLIIHYHCFVFCFFVFARFCRTISILSLWWMYSPSFTLEVLADAGLWMHHIFFGHAGQFYCHIICGRIALSILRNCHWCYHSGILFC